ncbi:MAG: ATP-dependent helicase, partial [Desulfobacteraceae bacterium]
AQLETLLRGYLEKTGLFGARFRECAGRALILTRSGPTQRMPLWLSRLRSQKLLQAVQRYADFPILLETWRTCLQDEFDLENLIRVLDELRSGAIRWSEVYTDSPSPLAQGVSWQLINKYMYQDDTPAAGKQSNLRQSLLQDLMFTPELRPAISPEIMRSFELKRQRLAPGYAPRDPADLLDWVKERLLIPLPEWEQLLQTMQNESNLAIPDLLRPLSSKLVRLQPGQAIAPLITSLEFWNRLQAAFYAQDPDLKAELLVSDLAMAPLATQTAPAPPESRDEALLGYLNQWLRFYGPRTPDFIAHTLGLSNERLQIVLEDLIEDNQMILGPLITADPTDQICLTENFEILLRLGRAQARPVFEALRPEYLQLFLAQQHGLTESARPTDALTAVLEPLLFYPAKALLWETEILPARLPGYDPTQLDRLMQEGELTWTGSAVQKIAFSLTAELNLILELQESPPTHAREPQDSDSADNTSLDPIPDDLADLFPDPIDRYDFSALLNKTNARPAPLTARLWKAVWQGRITNDTFSALRRGLETRFQMPEMPETPLRKPHRGPGKRLGFQRFKQALPYGGHWYRLPADIEPPLDLLETEERKKDCVRLLLDRYGILFRELLEKELPGLRWTPLFRTLRLMEFSGELLSGHFFQGIMGPQFVSLAALQTLQQKPPEDAVFWLNAADPIALCGLDLPDLKKHLPARLTTTHLVFHGTRLVLISKKLGKELVFHVLPEDPRLPEYLSVLRHLLTRTVQPLRRIRIESINALPASCSPYLGALQIAFDLSVEHRDVVIYKKI